MFKKFVDNWYEAKYRIQHERDRRKFEKFINYCERRGMISMSHSKYNGKIKYSYKREEN